MLLRSFSGCEPNTGFWAIYDFFSADLNNSKPKNIHENPVTLEIFHTN
jgi:hypothetical protein